MKRIIIMALTGIFALGLSTTNTFAQENKVPKVLTKVKESIDPGSIAGLNDYQTELMLKALKIRKASKKSEVSAILDKYNSGLSTLKDDNLGLIVGLGTSVKDIIQSKDFKMLWSARTDYKEQVDFVRKEQVAMHETLEDELMEVLTRREKRKWHKYQEKMRKEADATFDMGDLFTYVGF